MPRRNLIETELKRLERSIHRGLSDSPLATIGHRLLDVVIEVGASLNAGSVTAGKVRSVIAFVSAMLQGLPQSFGARFAFDSFLVQSIAAEWSCGEIKFSSMIVPRHAKEWGHLTAPMPSSDGVSAHAVDVILFPGDDDIESIDLLEYPWIGHELGHNLHFRTDHFAECFRDRLHQRLTVLQALAIADRGTARRNSMAATNMIRQFWSPSRDHKNWAHEIAVDIVALWTFGPAFLFAFDEFVERHDPDPYRIGQVHPPYHLRASAMVDAASRLLWGDFTDPLQHRIDGWSGDAPNSYEYATLSDEDLLIAAVTCGLDSCKIAGLPRLTAERADELRAVVRTGALPEFGSELVVAAWLAQEELEQAAFAEWHNRVVRELAKDVTLESQT